MLQQVVTKEFANPYLPFFYKDLYNITF